MYYLYYGDITNLHVDAIINPVHNTLIGKAGLSGHIQKLGGSQLAEKCEERGELKYSETFLTHGYELFARHVIHILSPMWLGGGSGELTKLEICYVNCINIALEKGFKEVAFPAIGTGLDGFPPLEATQVALRVVSNYLDERQNELDVIFCCFNEDTREAYRDELKQRGIDFVNYTVHSND
ncbi:MAG: macro domain-containing protein [candidate division SR1 bacterium]|nr:macro domain-containing protein [candidate division SR1 bacterium]